MAGRVRDEDARVRIWEEYLLATHKNLVEHARALLTRTLRRVFWADDVVQEAYLQFCLYPERFRGKTQEDFRVWAKSVTENTAHNLARTQEYQKRSSKCLCYLEELDRKELKEPESMGLSAESLLEEREQREVLRAAVLELSALEAKVIDLVYLHERTVSLSEAAEILGLSVSGVRKVLSRSLEKLYFLLKSRWEYKDLLPCRRSHSP
jgi:RNA polymerase sigma factor (sigma-70 family)